MSDVAEQLIAVDRRLLERAYECASDQAARYWCWLHEDYEKADVLRVELAALLGIERERQPWPSK